MIKLLPATSVATGTAMFGLLIFLFFFCLLSTDSCGFFFPDVLPFCIADAASKTSVEDNELSGGDDGFAGCIDGAVGAFIFIFTLATTLVVVRLFVVFVLIFLLILIFVLLVLVTFCTAVVFFFVTCIPLGLGEDDDLSKAR